MSEEPLVSHAPIGMVFYVHWSRINADKDYRLKWNPELYLRSLQLFMSSVFPSNINSDEQDSASDLNSVSEQHQSQTSSKCHALLALGITTHSAAISILRKRQGLWLTQRSLLGIQLATGTLPSRSVYKRHTDALLIHILIIAKSSRNMISSHCMRFMHLISVSCFQWRIDFSEAWKSGSG